GFKPTFGAFDLRGVRPLAPSLDTLGFFVRAVGDVPWLLAAAGGSSRPAPLELQRKPPRLGLCRTDQWPRATAETQRLVEQAGAAPRRARPGAARPARVRRADRGSRRAGHGRRGRRGAAARYDR